ncbi:MAG: hypothetical protein ACR2PG_10805, partial [Hyphomicrobiaceae bacterium]
LWVSTTQYVLFVRSPRPPRRSFYRRRNQRKMRVFVFHEFHNSTRNTDVYDTISAHRGSVFTPFYLSKPQRDPDGRTFVVLVQVAPYDVASRHAANHGNRGPGIEVAKNRGDKLFPIQAKAGIVIATILKQAMPRLRLVHHRGIEGLPMLRAYRQWKKSSRKRILHLPFAAVTRVKLAQAVARLDDLIMTPGSKVRRPRPVDTVIAPPAPKLISAPRKRASFPLPPSKARLEFAGRRTFDGQGKTNEDPIGGLLESLSNQ